MIEDIEKLYFLTPLWIENKGKMPFFNCSSDEKIGF